MGSFALFIDGTEATKARWMDGNQNTAYNEQRIHFRWPFHISGSSDSTTGKQSTWTSAKEIKLQFAEYGSSLELKLHTTEHWLGTGNNQFSMPTIGITALA